MLRLESIKYKHEKNVKNPKGGNNSRKLKKSFFYVRELQDAFPPIRSGCQGSSTRMREQFTNNCKKKVIHICMCVYIGEIMYVPIKN